MTTWKEIREKYNHMRGAPPDADVQEMTREEAGLFLAAMVKTGVLSEKWSPVPMTRRLGNVKRFNDYYFDCPRCSAEVRPSMAKCHGAKVADAIQCPVCGIPATLSILEGRRDAMAMTWSCAFCFKPKTFKKEELYDIDAAQCPHCGAINLFGEEP